LPFHKITFNTVGGMDRACVYNRGCNFRCKGCAYKLKPTIGGKEEQGSQLGLDKVRATLESLEPKRVHFLGGEPTTNPLLPQLARFAHEELGALTKVGHTNGSGRIPDYVDEAAFSIKAYTNDTHEEYTGLPNNAVLRNFVDAYERGIRVSASTVLIPGVVDATEVGRVAEFVGGVNRSIHLHITTYIPVPSAPYQSPSARQLNEACSLAMRYVGNVTYKVLTQADFLSLKRRDELYNSIQVA
jgi:pyruvate formate lyase activating enzyme